MDKIDRKINYHDIGAIFQCNALLVHRIDSILANKRELEEVCHRSYRHSNGFVKIPIAWTKQMQQELRLHFWDSFTGGTSTPHNHPWPFVSRVLSGELTNVIFREDEPTNPERRFRKYQISPSIGTNWMHIVEKANDVNLIKKSKRVVRVGQHYSLEPSTIHQTLIPKQLETITLMHRGRFSTESSFVYTKAEIETGRVSVDKLDKREVTLQLERMMAQSD